MKKNYNLISAYIITILIAVCTTASAQVLDDIQSKFTSYQNNILQEKLYVHTDRDFYIAGELLWFKIYDINAVTNKSLTASKVAYAEVLDKDNNAILQAKIDLDKSTGNGSFYLPVSAITGNYKVRAYTSWMKNFSPDKYFEKNITIVNSLKEITLQTNNAANADYDIQFFPEGGNLVNGLTNKIAYRVTGSDGKGIEFTGAIVNRNNDTIVRFKPHKFGIGTFMLKPDAANTYKAVLKINGKSITAVLPAIASEGYVMQLTDADADQLKVTVNTTVANAGNLYLIAHTRQNIAVAKMLTIAKNEASFLIDKNKLGDGISHLTIFNDNKQPVCERLYSKRPAASQKLTIEAFADKAEYTSRKKVAISVLTKGIIGNAEAADMSVSVYRLDSLQNLNSESIYTYLWLTSELKGNIESPDYYLNNNDDEALDNLMLTHGWSKYNWDDILQFNVVALKYLPEYDSHIITGKVTDPKTNAAVKNETVLLTVPGRRIQLYNAQTDASGNFIINTKNFVGQNEIVVQPRLEQDTLLEIQILNPFSERFSSTKLPMATIKTDLYNSLSIHSLSMQVQNIYSGEKIKQQYTPQIDTTSAFNGVQKTYLLDNYTRFTTMEEVLREYVHEVIVSKPKDRFRFRILNDDYYMANNQPLVLFDGIPVYNFNKIIAADPLKVRKLEVIPHIYYKGASKEYGLVSFTTYKGDLGGVEIDPHALVMDYEGLQLKRTFFSPVYETQSQIADHLPDFRTLLYWSPNVTTDTNGKAAINFYTSDQTGKYIGVIQGISTTGKAGIQVFNIEVKDGVTP
jgi:hypothetical protein